MFLFTFVDKTEDKNQIDILEEYFIEVFFYS